MQGTRLNARRRRIIFEVCMIALLVVLIAVDQIVKHCIKGLHDNTDWTVTEVIPNFFYFTYVVNTGSAWSFLAGVPWAQTFFKVLTGVALVLFGLYYYFVTKKKYRVLKVALVLIIAGTVGNFIDRLIFNGVIDFIGFIFGSYYFPVFNLADSFMTVGIVLLIVHYLFLDKNALFKRKKKVEDKDENVAEESTEPENVEEITVVQGDSDENKNDADKTV